MMGAPASSTGTVNFPFPVDDISKTNGALGKGKGTFERKYTFRAWPQSYLDLLTDRKGNHLAKISWKSFDKAM
jgi:hypothetical protein